MEAHPSSECETLLLSTLTHTHHTRLFLASTDDGSNRLNVTNNVVVSGGLWKDGIANSHKHYQGNVELFGQNCFNSGQWDQGSSNFTDNHCFQTAPSSFNCKCNRSTGNPPCPTIERNHYYQQNQTYSVCGKTLPELQSAGFEQGSTVAEVPPNAEIMELVKTTLLGAAGI